MEDRKKEIKGFSKLSKVGKMKWIVEHFFADPEGTMRELMSYWLEDGSQQDLIDGFSENTISNFLLPYSVAPNFLIDEKLYAVPMVIEESSVVAAASAGAKYWLDRGGFHTEIIGTEKVGQVHFRWQGSSDLLLAKEEEIKDHLFKSTTPAMKNMIQRGGGLLDIKIVDMKEGSLYQLFLTFDTVDSMGANFINTVLEICGRELSSFVENQAAWPADSRRCEVIMCILSNYTPHCTVRAMVESPLDKMTVKKNMTASEFVDRFSTAVRIAEIDTYRAVTHNKGIYNGIDAVVMATGNDYRAVEAAGHSYASRAGKYSSLSNCEIENDTFRFWLEVPLAIGTVGGLTSSHPMAKKSLELMDNPTSGQLMSIMASVGLAQNFSAVRSLVTTGIQEGHMKMHLNNILHQLDATSAEKEAAVKYFETQKVSYQSVRNFLKEFQSSEVE